MPLATTGWDYYPILYKTDARSERGSRTRHALTQHTLCGYCTNWFRGYAHSVKIQWNCSLLKYSIYPAMAARQTLTQITQCRRAERLLLQKTTNAIRVGILHWRYPAHYTWYKLCIFICRYSINKNTLASDILTWKIDINCTTSNVVPSRWLFSNDSNAYFHAYTKKKTNAMRILDHNFEIGEFFGVGAGWRLSEKMFRWPMAGATRHRHFVECKIGGKL